MYNKTCTVYTGGYSSLRMRTHQRFIHALLCSYFRLVVSEGIRRVEYTDGISQFVGIITEYIIYVEVQDFVCEVTSCLYNYKHCLFLTDWQFLFSIIIISELLLCNSPNPQNGLFLLIRFCSVHNII